MQAHRNKYCKCGEVRKRKKLVQQGVKGKKHCSSRAKISATKGHSKQVEMDIHLELLEAHFKKAIYELLKSVGHALIMLWRSLPTSLAMEEQPHKRSRTIENRLRGRSGPGPPPAALFLLPGFTAVHTSFAAGIERTGLRPLLGLSLTFSFFLSLQASNAPGYARCLAQGLTFWLWPYPIKKQIAPSGFNNQCIGR